MFSLAMRLVLIAGSLFTFVFMLLRIRASRVRIRSALYWLVFALLLLVLSLFPQLAVWASRLLGIAAPINFVYLFIIFLLLIKLFGDSMHIAQLDAKLRRIAQRIALDEKDAEDGKTNEKGAR